MEFDSTKIYYMHGAKPAVFGLSDQDLKLILTDGRYASPFLEIFINNNFSNIEKLGADAKGKDYFYKDGSQKPLEMRGFPAGSDKKSIKLYPSYMIGAKRKYNEPDYLNNLSKISGHIIVYQETWLDYIVFHIPSLVTINNGHPIKILNRKDIPDYLGREPSSFFKGKSLQENHLYEFEDK